MIIELIGYLSEVSYSFNKDLDAVYVFCLFFSNVNDFHYPLKQLLKWLSLLCIVSLRMYFLYILTLISSSCLFSVFSSTHLFLELIFLIQLILVDL